MYVYAYKYPEVQEEVSRILTQKLLHFEHLDNTKLN